MGACEQNRVISINARPSSWPIARWPWLRATRGVHAATDLDPDEAIAAHATEPNGGIRDYGPFARDGARMTSHSASIAAPIQYP
jgi:hypothetical protein